MYDARGRKLLYDLVDNYLYQPDPTAQIVAEAQSLADLLAHSEPSLALCLRAMVEAICEQEDDACKLVEEAAAQAPTAAIPCAILAMIGGVSGKRQLALGAIHRCLVLFGRQSNPELLDYLAIMAGYLGDFYAMGSIVAKARERGIFSWTLVNGAMACLESDNSNEADAYLHGMPAEYNLENLLDVELDLANLDIRIQAVRDRMGGHAG